MTCEEFGLYPGGRGEPFEDSEQERGVKSVFKKDFSLAITDKVDMQGRGRIAKQGNGSVSRRTQNAATTLLTTSAQSRVICNSPKMRMTQMPINCRQMSKLWHIGTVESSAAERKEEVPLCTAIAAKLSRHTVTPKKPDTTSYAVVHYAKFRNRRSWSVMIEVRMKVAFQGKDWD